MQNNKNLAALLLAALALFGLPTTLFAVPLGLSKLANLSFGTIDFASSPAAGDITMGTDGTIAYGTNTSGSGIGTAGQIEITGDTGVTVTIGCSISANLASGINPVLPINPFVFVIGTANVGPYNAATPCNGEGNSVAIHTISAVASENIIIIGGIMAINGVNLTNGTYAGNSGTGTMPVFRVLVQ